MLVPGWNGNLAACAAYNFMPNEHSKESPFFLMFGREALLPLNTLFKPSVRYLENDEKSSFLGSFEKHIPTCG